MKREKRFFCILLSVCLVLTMMPTVSMAAKAETPAATDNGVNLYVDYGSGFEPLTTLYFGDSVESKTVNIDRPISALRVVKGDCYELNLDQLTLDGNYPVGYERKLYATDKDLIEIADVTDFILSGCGELVISARAPVELIGEAYSFKFPTSNSGAIIPQSDFYSYELNSKLGTFALGDMVAVPSSDYILAREMCYPTTGHPDAPVDIYVANDKEKLYVFFESFLDNTFDHGKDFVGVHVKCGDTIKTYKVHTTDTNEYGKWYFDYTNSSETYDWEHMCYSVEIPLEDLTANNDSLKLAFEYYGTSAYDEPVRVLCIGDTMIVNKNIISDSNLLQLNSTKDYYLPEAGLVLNSSGGDTKEGSWWIENTGNSSVPAFTLTLNGVNITSIADYKRGIDSSNLFVRGNMKIVLEEGSINTIGVNGGSGCDYGIQDVGATLDISGTGNLNVYGKKNAINAMYAAANVYDGATINCIATGSGSNNSDGIWANRLIVNKANITSYATGGTTNRALKVQTVTAAGCTLYEGDIEPGEIVEALTNTSDNNYNFYSKPYVSIVKQIPPPPDPTPTPSPTPSRPRRSPIIVLEDDDASRNGGTTSFDRITGTLDVMPAEGFEIADIIVNGTSKGKVTHLTGVNVWDIIKVTFQTIPEKTPEQIQAERNARISTGVQGTRVLYPWAVHQKNGKVKLTWKKSKGFKVDYYLIYRADKKGGKFDRVFKSETKRYITGRNLKKGKVVYFKVVGVREVGDRLIRTQFSRIESIRIK